MFINENVLRQSRKMEHIKYSLQTGDGPLETGFADVHLIHNCLARHNFSDIQLNTQVAGIMLEHPIIINAITGGDERVLEINRKLAILAKQTKCAMAVGSQYAAVKNPAVRDSFSVVRETNPEGIFFANVGAYAQPHEAKAVVDMIEADALQIHLNIAQELAMQEGDREFVNCFDNIKAIMDTIDVPVIVKETGCGIAMEQAQELLSCGVKAIDVSGAGGSNFIAIESARFSDGDASFCSWGISTAISTLEVQQTVKENVDIVVSGGVRSALDIVKALSCGGSAVGISAPFLQIMEKENCEQLLVEYIENLLLDSKKMFLLAGCASIRQLQEKPIVITGFVGQWLQARGIDLQQLCYSRCS